MVVNNLQIISNHWLRLRGFTVGLRDCVLKKPALLDDVKEYIQKCFYEADIVQQNIQNPKIRELKVQEILNRTQGVGLKIAKEGFFENNNFISMIESGSKGNYFNLCQIFALLGQQYIKGTRIAPEMNNGARTLYHYPFTTDYQSRGFISSNFYNGISPRDLFFHGEAGRAGVVDTAMGTSETGYMHRRIIKLLEDTKVEYDGSVRDDIGMIQQFTYGNGLDVTSSPEYSYIHNLVDIINNDYENLNFR